MRAGVFSWTVVIGLGGSLLMLSGCAKHADFVELREQLSTVSRTQEQDHQRVDAVLRRLESVERMKDAESSKPRLDELAARVQKLETRLAKIEDGGGVAAVRPETSLPDVAKPSKPVKPATQPEAAAIVPGVPGMSGVPTGPGGSPGPSAAVPTAAAVTSSRPVVISDEVVLP